MTEPAWLASARSYLGTKEKPGPQSNQTIVQFYRDAGNSGVSDDAVPWCAAFVGAMLKRSGEKGSGKLNARSYLDWGVKLAKPKAGAITVFKRGNSAWQGHVAFYLRTVGNSIEVLGGNQGDAVSIAKYPAVNLLGYRWPKEAVAPTADMPAPPRPPLVVDAPPPPQKPAGKPPAHPTTPNGGALAGGAAVAGGVAVAASAGLPWWGWLIAIALAGGLGFAGWYYRTEIGRMIARFRK